ncbi:3-hydroxyacyl-CoA dehydrogenase family protein [Haliangium sp.]|uniref:3-hydroxyacyl-CoA dehydrogenase family protein n=1 Tax=Haliangium sp. TaxID=2663208 RepID=UPI003D132A29
MSDTRLPTVDEVRAVAVLGAGTMGHGIAQVAAMAGWDAVLYDIDDGAVAAGRDRIAQNLDKGVARGKVTAEARDQTLGRLRLSTDVADAVSAADVVIEAAPERLDLKREIFTAVDRAAPAHALLASNTSSLSVAEIAAAVADPGRVVGMHFFNPVHIMKLIEVVAHDGSAPAAVELARAVGERMGKTPITVKDSPGFASSRLGLIIGLEAIRMLEQGVASAADIDTAMKLGYGYPMGPLELGDLVGLDVRLGISEYLSKELGARFEPPALLRQMVDEGKLGKKSGQGFYRWQDGKKQGS